MAAMPGAPISMAMPIAISREDASRLQTGWALRPNAISAIRAPTCAGPSSAPKLTAAASGIRSIARGTVPLALFGREGYSILMGRIAMLTLVAQAASPSISAWLLEGFGATTTLAVLCGAAILNIAMVVALLPLALRKPLGRMTAH